MKSQEQFIKEMASINPNIIILGQYTGTHNKIPCKCKICGYEWNGRPHDLLAGHGCRDCSYVKRGFGRQKTTEAFLNEMREKHPELEVISEYKSNHAPITVKCLKCNNIWTPSPGTLLRGSGCPECAKKIMGPHRINEQEFIERLNKVHPSIIYEKGYITFSGRSTFRCSKCGYEWEDSPKELLVHKGCPQCVKNKVHNQFVKSQSDFCADLYTVNPSIKVIGKYKTAQSNIKVKCLICGHEWSAKPNLLLRGSGCPRCSHTSTSYIEQLIRLSFVDILGNDSVISRDKTAIGLELDIYIPTIKLAIEYGAWIWHKKQLKRDIEKYLKCNNNGIRLIRIYDSCGDDTSAEGIDVFLFKNSVKKEFCREYLFMTWLFDKCNQPFNISESRFQELKNTAYELSRRKTTESFQEELKKKNPNIIVTGEYQSDSIKIAITCKKCGYKWSASPSNLLQGWGCPKCSHCLKRTQKQFISEMREIHPTIKVLGEYISSSDYVSCECKKCGYRWDAKPNGLLNQRNGCPKCSGRLRWTHQEFVDKLRQINPNIVVMGTYKNSSTSIQCKCIKCGHIWNPIPHNLIRGSGCPLCSRNRKHNSKIRSNNN